MRVNMETSNELDAKALTTFAKKLAAGTKATTDWKLGLALFERIPGWSVQRAVAPLLMTPHGTNLDQLTRRRGGKRGMPSQPARLPDVQRGDGQLYLYKESTFNEKLPKGSYAMLKDDYTLDALRAAVVIGLPDDVVEEQVYVEFFKVINVQFYDKVQAVLQLGRIWLGAQSAVITARESKGAPSVIVFDEPKAAGEFGSAAFYTWAKGTSLAQDVKGSSLMPDVSEEAQAGFRLGSLDHSGRCAICQRLQKTHGTAQLKPTMVDHGYQIPTSARWYGEAPRRGSCFGVGFPPLELSPVAAVKFLDVLADSLQQYKAALEKLPTVTKLTRTKWDYDKGREVHIEVLRGDPNWERVYEHSEYELKKSVTMTETQIAHYRELVKNWKRVQMYDEQKTGVTYSAPAWEAPEETPVMARVMARLRLLEEDP